MEKFGKIWSQDEKAFLIANYYEKGLNYCYNNLKNRSKRSVMKYANKLGLKMSEETRALSNRKYNKNDVLEAVSESLCIADVCRYFGLKPQAANYSNFKKIILFYNIDTSHFLTQSELSKIRYKTINFDKKDLNDCLVQGSNYDRKILKKRLFNEGYKEKKCELCGQSEIWNGNKLSFILDHINGINNDNRLENLRIICPNCDSTLDTYCSKNRNIKTKKVTIIKQSKIPSKEILILDFKELKTFTKVGKKYNVSDNAIRKWCIKYEILEIIRK
jgi:hypothetical protein